MLLAPSLQLACRAISGFGSHRRSLYLLLEEKVTFDSSVAGSYRTVCCCEKCLRDHLTPLLRAPFAP